MPDFAIHPIDDATCRHVRDTRTDPIYGYDYDVKASVAGPEGYGPCRRCLQRFAAGDRRLLFLYNPFGADVGDYAGPVFIHEHHCTAYPDSHELPAALSDIPMFVRAYDRDGHFLAQQDVSGDLTAAMTALFETRDTHELHIRNARAKCFIARVTRTP